MVWRDISWLTINLTTLPLSPLPLFDHSPWKVESWIFSLVLAVRNFSIQNHQSALNAAQAEGVYTREAIRPSPIAL